MELKMIIAGFGGQGVMVTGKLLGYAACAHNKQAMFLPQYGPEQRGGTASCTVILSEDEIGSPIVGKADVLMVFNQPSLEKFLPRLKEGGLLFANATLCDTAGLEGRFEVISIPVDDMAKEMGVRQVANIIMTGAFTAKTGIFTADEISETVKHVLGKKPELIDLNEEAVQKGIALMETATA